ncbi:60Kd inner membrane protein-domain-containing protein [Mycena metata]|uniref:60Kd inner membrane protein-domain-containing protein n=1 Tax=Mycena metata TaxID=1033252 RepID=A0AAD7DSZ9_9AGAR|nr:60Kd inner membrane protein-domain-containing protein [Mycena metata]
MASFAAFRGSLRLASARSPILVLPIPRHRLLSTINLYRIQRPQLDDTRWRNTRWSSSTVIPPPIPPTTALEQPPTPSLEEGLVSTGSELIPDPGFVDTVVASMPPLQHGDLQALGFCSWTPAGLVQYTFELTHILTGLPWFYTFIVATLFWRVILFPLTVIGMRNSARLRPVNAEMTAANEALQVARATGDTVAAQRAALQASRIRNEAGVSMLGLMAPVVQFPVSLGMFFGIKKMCELPVMQFTQSGFDLLPDLTAPGPYFILPALVAISGNAMITVGMRDMDTSRPMMGHVMNIFRVVSILAIYWMSTFPSGLMLSLFVTSATAVLQALLFRVPSVRAALGIPPWKALPGPPPPTVRDTFRYFFVQGSQGREAGAMASPAAKPVPHYVPPNASAKFTPLKTPAPPTSSPVKPAQPGTLEMLAQQAQARANGTSSGLYEAPTPKAAKPAATTAATKKAKATKKPKASKSA